MSVALWNWRLDTVPEARLVVAWPAPEGLPYAAYDAGARHVESGRHLVVSGVAFNGEAPPGIIPAPHVERQADLEGRVCSGCEGRCAVMGHGVLVDCAVCKGSGRIGGLRALLAVQAERHALVVSPREAIGLGVDMQSTAPMGWLACPGCNGWGGGETGGVDVNGYPYEADCGRCKGARTLIDLIVIAGFDEPIHPEHVRSLVAQGRAAGVPTIFAGWGSWLPVATPRSGYFGERILMHESGAITRNATWADVIDSRGPVWAFEQVGAARSGALLDGEEVCDVPEWLGGEV